jgi:hypothetical protein
MSEQRQAYQDALRAIGHFLDVNIYRHIILVETSDAFILHAFHGLTANRSVEGIELPLSDIRTLVSRCRQDRGPRAHELPRSPICPTGYEDFFRTLGYDLDTAHAMLVRVVELSTGILVSYTAYNETENAQRFELLYTESHIEQALAQGYSRRVGPKPIHSLPSWIKQAQDDNSM